MPRTYEPIASQTLGSASASVTFSSIASTWTDLRLVIVGGIASGASENIVCLRFNSDTGANYSDTHLWGNGSSPQNGRSTNTTFTRLWRVAIGGQSVITTDIMSYANSNVFKTVLSANANPAESVWRVVGLWRSTSAITSVTVLENSGNNFSSGSTFSIYGIKAA
jgi:hypothetical protein